MFVQLQSLLHPLLCLVFVQLQSLLQSSRCHCAASVFMQVPSSHVVFATAVMITSHVLFATAVMITSHVVFATAVMITSHVLYVQEQSLLLHLMFVLCSCRRCCVVCVSTVLAASCVAFFAQSAVIAFCAAIAFFVIATATVSRTCIVTLMPLQLWSSWLQFLLVIMLQG